MPPGGSYTMALVVDPPRRSARLASSTPKEAEEGDIDSPDEVSDSDSDEMGWEIEYEDTSDCPRDKHVLALTIATVRPSCPLLEGFEGCQSKTAASGGTPTAGYVPPGDYSGRT